ncbi:MAG: Stage sporulation protein [Verrucomicrobiota bacterium]|jgi:penicillin-binding protein 2
MSVPSNTRRKTNGPNSELRLYFMAFVMVFGLAVLVARLWWMQVAHGERWARRISNRSEVTVRIPAVRGEIRDRNGITLVGNRASYEVDFYLPDMVRGYRQQFGKPPMATYTAPVRNMLKEKREEDVVQIVNSTIVPRLLELRLAKDYNSVRLQRHYRNNTEVPFTYLEELDFQTIARFSENDVGLPGVEIALRPVRQYVYGALGAHLLGYVGAPVDVDKQPDIRNYTFYQPDAEGKSQVEQHMDRWIRGTPGVRVLQRNVKGVIESEVRRVEPKQGHHVYLTIDARMQFIVERALRDAGVGRGAAVVVDPNTGEVLAMASVPSYDPNVFIPSITRADWQKIREDDTNPLTNRAIQGYAPGSTYKAVSALAGLRKGLTVKNTFNCSGGISYGAKYMKCWTVDKHLPPHGNLILSDALKYSCNAFFYQWGNAAGIESIVAVGQALGLGQKSGLPLSGEDPGILPGPEWLKAVSPQERWSNGYTANVSIGQGSVEASPLQMCMVAATIANRGRSYAPRLVARVVDGEGRDALDPDTGLPLIPKEPELRADLHDAGITDEEIELVRRGMWKVVNEPGGTGQRAQVKGLDAAGKKVDVAGKTGTAQFWREVNGKKEKDNHTWFISFAPYDAPKLAVCVFVQGAKSGGGVSAPIAQRIFEQGLALERGFDPGLTRLEAAPGSFALIDDVKYKSGPVSGSEASDRETADHTEIAVKRPSKANATEAKPDIRPEADERGKVSAQPPKDQSREKRGFFEKLFGPRRTDAPISTPTTPAGKPAR